MIPHVATRAPHRRPAAAARPLPPTLNDPPLDRYHHARTSSRSANAAISGAFDADRGVRTIAQRSAPSTYGWLDSVLRENAQVLSHARSAAEVAKVIATASGGAECVALAARHDVSAIERHARSILMRAGSSASRVDTIVDGIVQGMSAVVVNSTLREPLTRSYVEALTSRNRELERLATDPTQAQASPGRAPAHDHAAAGDTGLSPSTSPPDAEPRLDAARDAMIANDRLAHQLTRAARGGLSDRLGVYAIDADFTRHAIDTDKVGLPSGDYPFTNAEVDTLAKRAVLEEVRNDARLGAEESEQLRSAVRATRRAPPDYLELMPR